MNNVKLRNTLAASDWYDINFFEFLAKDLKSKKILNAKRYTISNDIVSARTLSHWQQIELISDERPDGRGWRRFSLTEVIWLQIINKLRKFGMQLDLIKRVKSYLELYSSDEGLSKFPELDFYVLFCLNFRKPVKLLVFDNGEALLGSQVDIDLAKSCGSIVDDYISIDINLLLKSILKKVDFQTDYLNYSLPPMVSEIQNTLYTKDIQKITVNIGRDEYIMDKSFIKASKREVNALFEKFSYAEMTTKKYNNKKVYSVSVKTKFKV